MIQNSSQAFMDSHKEVELLLLSTVIGDLEIEISDKRYRDPRQALVVPAQRCRITIVPKPIPSKITQVLSFPPICVLFKISRSFLYLKFQRVTEAPLQMSTWRVEEREHVCMCSQEWGQRSLQRVSEMKSDRSN